MMKNMYKKEYSEILGIFYGIHVSQIASLDGKEIKSYSPEPYFMVDLAIDFNSSKIPNILNRTLYVFSK